MLGRFWGGSGEVLEEEEGCGHRWRHRWGVISSVRARVNVTLLSMLANFRQAIRVRSLTVDYTSVDCAKYIIVARCAVVLSSSLHGPSHELQVRIASVIGCFHREHDRGF